MRNKTKQSGFTLIELIVSISIMAILTALALSNYHRQGEVAEIDKLYYSLATMLHDAQEQSLSGSLASTGQFSGQGSLGYGVTISPGYSSGSTYNTGTAYQSKFGIANNWAMSLSGTVNTASYPAITLTQKFPVTMTLCNENSANCISAVVSGGGSLQELDVLFSSPFGKITQFFGQQGLGFSYQTPTNYLQANKIVYINISNSTGTLSRQIIINGVTNKITP